MKRPALFLWCRIKTDSIARPIVFPVPLYLLEDFLHAVFAVTRFAGRWVSWQQLGEYGGLVQQALQELPRLLRELRSSGPFTLVEVYDPDGGTEVILKLV